MPRNVRSQRVVEKCGFRHEGVALRYLRINGVWEDHDIYAMTSRTGGTCTRRENVVGSWPHMPRSIRPAAQHSAAVAGSAAAVRAALRGDAGGRRLAVSRALARRLPRRLADRPRRGGGRGHRAGGLPRRAAARWSASTARGRSGRGCERSSRAARSTPRGRGRCAARSGPSRWSPLPARRAAEGLADDVLAAVAALPDEQRIPIALRHLLGLHARRDRRAARPAARHRQLAAAARPGHASRRRWRDRPRPPPARRRPPRGRRRRSGARTRSRWRRSGAAPPRRRRRRAAARPGAAGSRRCSPPALLLIAAGADVRSWISDAVDVLAARAGARRDAAGRRAPAHGRARRALRALGPRPAADLRRRRRGRLVAARPVRGGDARDRADRGEPARASGAGRCTTARRSAIRAGRRAATRSPTSAAAASTSSTATARTTRGSAPADGAAPAWRRARGHSQVAYAHGRTRGPARHDRPPRPLRAPRRAPAARAVVVAPTAERLLVVERDRIQLLDQFGARAADLARPARHARTSPARSPAAAATGRSCARQGASSRLMLVSGQDTLKVLELAGRVDGITYSPSGRWLALGVGRSVWLVRPGLPRGAARRPHGARPRPPDGLGPQ